MTQDPENVSAAAKYIRTYLSIELIQGNSEADVDPQLSSIITLIVEKISKTKEGIIIDIGCGTGTLLSRLVGINQFMDSTDWLYFGTDTNEHLDIVQRLARNSLINRRVELLDLDQFYANWPKLSSPQLIFCRNVLHELDIAQTSQLLSHITLNSTFPDEIVIQDLLKLPESERHNACWTAEHFSECMKSHGFEKVTMIAQGSRSGNRWFNMVAPVPTVLKTTTITESRNIVSMARQTQWSLWANIENQDSSNLLHRNELVEALDLDLQLAALTRQLRNDGVLQVTLDREVSKRLRNSEFVRKISSFVAKRSIVSSEVTEIVHFRERGEQLDALENFLRSNGTLSLIYGGGGTGKTTILRHILRTRTYDKAAVYIDASVVKSFWSFFERLSSQLGLDIDPDTISVLDDVNYSTIEPAVRQFINFVGSRAVVAYDNFDEVLDSNGKFIDQELERMLCTFASKPGTKLILSSRAEVLPASLQIAAGPTMATIVRVGRYGTDQTVINVLDDRFDRGRAGLDKYPDRLIEAIDRHPLVTALAAQALEKFGPSVLLDDQFITELRLRLRNELWNRLVDDGSRPAVLAASALRVPVPVSMIEKLAPSESLHRARTADLLYSIQDRRWQALIALLGLFRLRAVEAVLPERVIRKNEDGTEHAKIADLYWETYRADDDPKWVRESHYHRMLSGELVGGDLAKYAGKYYVPELVASADYCFVSKHDYKTALELYNAATPLTQLSENARMRQASCLVRLGDRRRGEQIYAALVQEYSNNLGIKTSHIDALLYIQDYQAALNQIGQYRLTDATSSWVAQQIGRAHLGLDHYEEAIEVFKRLVSADGGDPYSYVYLGRALYQFGARDEAILVLRTGRDKFRSNVAIQTSLGVDLERSNIDAEALEVLQPIFDKFPDNARAALAIIRILIRGSKLQEARGVLRIVERNAVQQDPHSTIVARCEILIAEGKPEVAADILRFELKKDMNYLATFLDASYQWASAAREAGERRRIAAEAVKVSVPDRWKRNVPIQVRMARVAILAEDQEVFERIIRELRPTRIHQVDMEWLQDQWRMQMKQA